jgi:hypothetical protein
METSEYEHFCKRCNSVWHERRLEPYQKPHYNKICPKCLTKGDTRVVELGGLTGSKNCGNCDHFKPLDDEKNPWGKCSKGRELDSEAEYTLTWAIDNVEGCLVDFDEHDRYGDDILGLVHSFDVCGDFEEAQ